MSQYILINIYFYFLKILVNNVENVNLVKTTFKQDNLLTLSQLISIMLKWE